MVNVTKNIVEIKKQIKNISENANLVAVSKYRTVEEITVAIEAGHKIFGENKVQEAKTKWPSILKKYSDIKLHMIGGLQTNKAKDAVALFNVIESLDRISLAKELAKEEKKQGKKLEYYIQVNTGHEEQKSGVIAEEFEDLYKECEKLGLNVVGLMCIPPFGECPQAHFKLLKKMAAQHNLSNLSMGMSSDYEIALELGATHVRIGTAIFGERVG